MAGRYRPSAGGGGVPLALGEQGDLLVCTISPAHQLSSRAPTRDPSLLHSDRGMGPCFRRDDNRGWGWATTRTAPSHNERSWFAVMHRVGFSPSTTTDFRVSFASSVVHEFRNRFRPLSEICTSLSPRVPTAIDFPHRRTESEIMTSDWCGEAGWFGCRFEPGQAGKV